MATLHFAVGAGARCNRHGMASNKRTPVSVALTQDPRAVTCLDCQRLIDGDEHRERVEALHDAAPAMLEALRKIVALPERSIGAQAASCQVAKTIAREAIAKASPTLSKEA